MVFSARKRGNPFVARSRQRRAAERAEAQMEPSPSQPEPAPEPEPVPVAEASIVPPDRPLGDLTEVAERAEAEQSKPLGRDELADAVRGTWLDADTNLDNPGPRGHETTRPADVPEAVAKPEPESVKRGRGRPRPQETIERDNAVYNLLKANPAGVSKAELARALGEKEQQVYSSLRQLSKEGRAKTGHVKDVGYPWFAKKVG